MLNKVNDSTNNTLNINNNQVNQTTGTDSAALLGKSNPYNKIDKNLLIDELDISDNAIKLYQKDIDIKNFAKLALSDPEDTTHNQLVASQMENGVIQFNDNDLVESLFNNSKFLKDLAG